MKKNYKFLRFILPVIVVAAILTFFTVKHNNEKVQILHNNTEALASGEYDHDDCLNEAGYCQQTGDLYPHTMAFTLKP